MNELEGNPPILEVHESSSPIPIVQESISLTPTTLPPSILVTSFDWSQLESYLLPSYVPFQIIVQYYHMAVPSIVIDDLDFNLLLGCDYVYVMGALVSSLFRVIYFPHDGSTMIIDQLTFIGSESNPNQPSSLNGSYVQAVSPPPQVNYVATCSMLASTNDIIDNVVYHLLGALLYDLSIGSFDTF